MWYIKNITIISLYYKQEFFQSKQYQNVEKNEYIISKYIKISIFWYSKIVEKNGAKKNQKNKKDRKYNNHKNN